MWFSDMLSFIRPFFEVVKEGRISHDIFWIGILIP
jgi:hypothetical protein